MAFIGHRWTRVASELRNTPGAIATLRILTAHGVINLTQPKDVRPGWNNRADNEETRSIDELIDFMHDTER
jgi:hypothetical protein